MSDALEHSPEELEELPVLEDVEDDAAVDAIDAGRPPEEEAPPPIKVIAQIAGILVVAVIVAGVFVATRKQPPRSPAKPRVTGVRVAEAAVRDVKPEVSGLGRTRPARTVLISAQVGGLAEEVHEQLEDGAYLAEGLIAVRIDDADHVAEAQRLRALLDVARAEHDRLHAVRRSTEARIALVRDQLALERDHLARTKRLFEKGAGTDRDIESAELAVIRARDSLINQESALEQLGPQIAAAKARITEAEANHARAKLNLARTTVRVPFAGLVSNVSVERHQLLSPGTPLFELWLVDRVEVPVALSLADARLLASDLNLREGVRSDEAEKVDVEHEGEHWTGVLERFEPVDGDTQTVKAVVRVENPENQSPLHPRVFCRVTLRGAQAQRALTIPVEAVQEQNRVYAVREGKLAVTQPTFGPRLGRWIVVTSGIEAGEQVIVSPLEKVVEGSQVTVIEVEQ